MAKKQQGGRSRARTRPSAYRPRQLWVVNLAPLVTGARQGAAHAVKAASRERARARKQDRWWSQRWLVATAAGVVAVGAAAGTYAVVSKRRSAAPEPGTEGTETTPRNGLKSTVEASRSKVADLARTMAHKVRRDGAGAGQPGQLPLDGADRQVVTQP